MNKPTIVRTPPRTLQGLMSVKHFVKVMEQLSILISLNYHFDRRE